MRILPPTRPSTPPSVRLHISRRWSITLQTSTIVLGSACFFLLCVLQYYRGSSYRDPTSKFFDSTRAYEKKYSQQRVQEAETFIYQSEGNSSATRPKHAGTPTLCIGMASVARRGDQYLNLTVGSLLSGLGDESRWPMFLNILIAHTDPSKHPAWHRKWLHRLSDQVLTYEQTRADVRTIRTWEDEGRLGTKTIHDYTLVMQNCYDTGARYVLMLEDDVLAADGWYERTIDALGQIEATMQTRASEKWVYLRLFYVDGYLGWNSEHWPYYLFWSFTTWALLSGSLIMARNQSQQCRHFCTTTTTFILSLVFIPAAILLFFMAGRLSTWPLARGIHEMNNYGCCSQSLVFPRAIIPEVIARADPSSNSLVDMMLEDIADREHWVRWALVPSVFQHIGAVSSKGSAFDQDAKKLWNFRFEEHVPPARIS